MRDYTGIAPSTLPPPEAPNFKPRLRDMLSDVDYFLKDLNKGLARIQSGEIPDGSGNPIGHGGTLTDYFYLPGRSDGQVGYGSTAASGTLTLGSTANATKGSILLGSSSAYDEANVRLGVGETVPTAVLHVRGSPTAGAALFVTDITNISSVPNVWQTGTAGSGDGAVFNDVGYLRIDDPVDVQDGDATFIFSGNMAAGTAVCEANVSAIALTDSVFITMRRSGSIPSSTFSIFVTLASGARYTTTFDPSTYLTTSYVTYPFPIASMSQLSDSTANIVRFELLVPALFTNYVFITQMYVAASVDVATAISLTEYSATSDVPLDLWRDASENEWMKLDSSGTLTVGAAGVNSGQVKIIAQGSTGQSVDLQRWVDSTGVVLTSITSTGDVAGGSLVSDSLNLISNTQSTSVARISLNSTQDVVFDVPAGTVNPLTLSMGLVSGTLSGLSLTVDLQDTGGNNSTLSVDNRGGSATPVPFKIYRATIGSTANLTEWRDEVAGGGNSILSRIDSNGAFFGPTGASLTVAGYPSFGFDALGQIDAAVVTRPPSISGTMVVSGAPVNLTGQTASIGSTTLLTPSATGMFMIVAYMACTTAGDAGDSVTLNLSWNDGASAKTTPLASLLVDSSGSKINTAYAIVSTTSAISYSTTLTSPGAGTPAHTLYIRALVL